MYHGAVQKKIINQSGFTVIELLLILIIVLIAGFSGYYVWHNNKTKPTNSGTQQPAAKTTTQPSSSSSTISDDTAIKSAVVNYNAGQKAGSSQGQNTLQPGYQINIQHQNSSFALGSWSYPNADGASSWFAQKNSDGTWQVLSEGTFGHCDELALHGLSSWDLTCTSQ